MIGKKKAGIVTPHMTAIDTHLIQKTGFLFGLRHVGGKKVMGENRGKCIIILQKIDGHVIWAKNRRYSDIKS